MGSGTSYYRSIDCQCRSVATYFFMLTLTVSRDSRCHRIISSVCVQNLIVVTFVMLTVSSPPALVQGDWVERVLEDEEAGWSWTHRDRKTHLQVPLTTARGTGAGLGGTTAMESKGL